MRFAFLSDKFYEDYPANRYPEIEQKRNRPYVVVFITIGERIFAIPMRSHIRHPHAYLTDKVNQCGVDYTKAVVIIDEQKYIDSVKQPLCVEKSIVSSVGCKSTSKNTRRQNWAKKKRIKY